MKTLIRLFILTLLVAANAQSASHNRSSVMQAVVDEAVRQNVSPALALAIAHTESNFNPLALSHAGARGVMQIVPATGRGEFGLSPSQLYDRDTNIRAGIQFIKQLINTYDGRVDIALSHYNGGSRVRKPSGRLAVIPATRNYVTKVRSRERYYATHNIVLAAANIKPNTPRYVANRGSLTNVNRNIVRKSVALLDDFSNGYINKKRINRLIISQAITAKDRAKIMTALGELRNKNTTRSNHIKLASMDPRIVKVREWESYR
jgi:hypothetical protein